MWKWVSEQCDLEIVHFARVISDMSDSSSHFYESSHQARLNCYNECDEEETVPYF